MARKSIGERQLEAALDEVSRLGVDGLRLRWQALYGTMAPPTFRARLLHAAVAYKLQEQVHGGLKPGTRRLLRRIADEADRPGRRPGRGQHGAADLCNSDIAAGLANIAEAGMSAAAVPSTGLNGDSMPEGESGSAPGFSRTRSSALQQHVPLRIKPGTRLLRTWQGTTHEVLVGDAGVTYRGQQYRSLSEVARIITGQRWSGPLFFGLKRRPQHAAA